MARGPGAARPDRDHGRCDGGDLFGVSHRGGGHGLDLPGLEGGLFGARPADEPLYGSRGAHDFHTPKAGGEIDRVIRPRWDGRSSNWASSISGPIRRITRRKTGVLPNALGARPIGADIRDAAGSSAEGTQARRHNRHRGRQRLPPRGLSASPQRPLRGRAAGEGSAFTPIPGVDLGEILCVEEERQVGQDNCVAYRTLNPRTAIRGPVRPHFVKARVQGPRLLRRLARPLPGPRCIGRYDEKGTIRDAKNAA